MLRFSEIEFIDRLSSMKSSLLRLFGIQDEVSSDIKEYQKKEEYIENYLNTLVFKDLPEFDKGDKQVIDHGLFKGIRISKVSDLQAGIVQKLLGVYEIEIAPAFRTMVGKQYDWAVNIGAAEGLYSIWIGQELNIPVYSFEQDYPTRKETDENYTRPKATLRTPLH